MKIFSQHHPAILLLYYLLINLLFFTLHPTLLLLSLIGVIGYLALQHSIRYVLQELLFYSVVICLITIMYASFAHNGVTPLFFYNDHAITKEAIIRGSMLGVTFVNVALWFKAFTETMQTNHFLFLFTKIHPKLGMFSSMCFRFFPFYKELWKQNKMGQQGMHYFTTASRFDRLGRWCALQIHTFTQAIEAVFWKPSIMLSKGYQKKRTQFQLFSWRISDTSIALFMLMLSCMLVLKWSGLQFNYYPKIATVEISPTALVIICIFYLLPAFIEGKETLKWHYLQSKI